MLYSPQVLFISSEAYPFSKSGGLGDVLGVLPLTLKNMGLDVGLIIPFYGRMFTAEYQIRLLFQRCPVGYPWPDITADIYRADYHGVPVYFVDRPEYFDRKHFYCTYYGDYFDNCERFIFFSRAALAWARTMDRPPAILHVHDWQTALIPAYLHFMRQDDAFWQQTKSMLTVHNLAFQGQYSARLFWESGLPAQAWHMDGAEHYGSFNMLKTGINFADLISTVSPNYALEVLTSEFGCGLEGVLNKKASRIRGILNGVDYSTWDPGQDRYLPQNYSVQNLKGKLACKEFLLQKMGLGFCLEENWPLLGFIGRLREQKGIDLLLEIILDLMQLNLGLVILGEGDLELETRLFNLVEQYPGRLAAYIGYTEEEAHLIMAGSDIFLMPSRYEPCGLTQLYSLRYGTLPVASAVGGLKDTVCSYPQQDCTGFIFDPVNSRRLLECIKQALMVWQQTTVWQAMQFRAMSNDFSWPHSARKYLDCYSELGLRLELESFGANKPSEIRKTKIATKSRTSRHK